MSKLVVAKDFAPVLRSLKAQPPQVLLLSGDSGMGLHAIATSLAPDALVVQPEKSKTSSIESISIESIRDLYLRSRGASRRATTIVIRDADKMTLPAQNAFLKLLEEPQSSIRFILTSHQPHLLLPTVRSRVHTYRVPRISEQQSHSLLEEYQLDTTDIAQILFVASGRPALLHFYANDAEAREGLRTLMRDGRDFLSNDHYKALKIGAPYAQSSQQLQRLAGAAIAILTHSLRQNPTREQLDRLEQLTKLADNLTTNANPKLQLLSVVV